MKLSNIPIAQWLGERSNGKIEMRWYRTNEEQYHSKIVYLCCQEENYVTLSSMNFSSHNLNNYNLENNIVVVEQNESSFTEEIESYFERIWHNEDAISSLPKNIDYLAINKEELNKKANELSEYRKIRI